MFCGGRMEVTILTQLVSILPNLAFGIICLWYLLQVLKEQAAANKLYASQLEHLIGVYQALLERTVAELAAERAERAKMQTALDQSRADSLEWRKEVLGQIERIERLIRSRAERGSADSTKP